MLESDLVKLRKIQVEYLKGKVPKFVTVHPWRRDWKYAILHSYRVERYVFSIFENEEQYVSQNEQIITRAASIIHDIGKQESSTDHAKRSGEIIRQLVNIGIIDFMDSFEVERLVDLVAHHSDKKDRSNNDFCMNVLKDADLLDETGILSILMSSNWVDRNDPYFFNEVQKRIEANEIKFCEDSMENLGTDYARKILRDKKKFIELVNDQFKNELMGISEI